MNWRVDELMCWWIDVLMNWRKGTYTILNYRLLNFDFNLIFNLNLLTIHHTQYEAH